MSKEKKNMDQDESKKYEFDKLHQLGFIVNDDNIERLSIDLLSWLHYVNEFYKAFKEKNPDKAHLQNSQIGKFNFIWIDDQNAGVLNHLEVTNKITGEKTIIKNTPPTT